MLERYWRTFFWQFDIYLHLLPLVLNVLKLQSKVLKDDSEILKTDKRCLDEAFLDFKS